MAMNSTVSPQPRPSASPYSSIPMILITLIALFGNILILVSVYRVRSLRTVSNIFIINLAVTDVIAAIIGMPLNIATVILNGDWIFGEELCQIEGFIVVILSVVSMYTLFTYSVYRYYLITSQNHMDSHKLARVVKGCVITIWIVSGLLSALPLWGWGEYKFLPLFYMCSIDWSALPAHSFVIFTFVFFIPLNIMMFSYYKIAKFMKTHNRKIKSMKQSSPDPKNGTVHAVVKSLHKHDAILEDIETPNRNGEPSSRVRSASSEHRVEPRSHSIQLDEVTEDGASVMMSDTRISSFMQSKRNGTFMRKRIRLGTRFRRNLSREAKLVRVLIVTVSAFIICWTPYSMDSLLVAYHYLKPRPPHFQLAAVWFAFSNTICNPIIYAVLNNQFRNAFKSTLKAMCSKLKKA